MKIRANFRIVFLVFLSITLLFQTATFAPVAIAQNTSEGQMPSWFKTNAKWWNEGRISDTEILNAIENLLNQGIIKLDSSDITDTVTTDESNSSFTPYKEDIGIPGFVKNIFVFWHEGQVSDSEVSNAIKFLIETKIINTPTSVHKQPRPLAAIIDQLDSSIPNQYFNEKARQHLELAGYQVDNYKTEDITVDFYKNLPSKNYKFIVIRTHGLEDPSINNATFLFTGEKYDINKHFSEQLSGQVGKGAPIFIEQRQLIEEKNENLDGQMYFLVGSKLVDELMVGTFPDSIIMIGGCESLRNKDLAKSLILRGASDVIGWDRTIGSIENDRVMLEFLEKVLVDKGNIEDVVYDLNMEFSPNLQFSSKLQHARGT